MNSASAISRHLLFGAASLYWLVPGHHRLFSATTSATAIDLSSILAIAALWLLCYGFAWRDGGTLRRRPAGWWLAGCWLAAALLACIGHGVSQGQGLAAKYYDNATFAGAAQRSWAQHCDGCTRIDRDIAFGSRGFSFSENYFPLFFANDFRLRPPDSAGANMEGYAFSVEWTGFIRAPSAADGGPVALRLVANGGPAELVVDGLSVPAGTGIEVAAGVHALVLRYARTEPAPPSLRLFWNLAGDEEIVPAAALSVAEPGPVWLAPALGLLALGLWGAALAAWVAPALPFKPRYRPVALWLLFALVFAAGAREIAADGEAFDFQLFVMGDDWLMYETFARELLASGDLLSRIEAPFVFWNFGYRYLLAGLHLLVGEAPADVIVLQAVVLALVVAGSAAAIGTFYGWRVAVVFVVIALAAKQLLKVSLPLLDTVWGIALGTSALFCLLAWRRQPAWRWVWLAGLSLGLGVFVRANFIPFAPVAAGWIALLSLRDGRHRQAVWQAVVFAVIVVALFSLLGWRNLIVAGEWRWLPDNGLVNLWIGNHPAEFDGPTYFTPRRIPEQEIVGQVIDYIRQRPGEWFERTWAKSLYVLGVDHWSGKGVREQVLLPWLLGIVGSVVLWRARSLIPRSELLLLWAWIAVVNGPLLVIFPWGYGWRLSAPSFIPLYLLSALFLVHVAQRIGARVPLLRRAPGHSA